MGKRLFFPLLGLLLAGCGPIYHTVYDYTPPASRDGMACVMQCENTRNQCQRANRLEREVADLKRRQCEERREREKEKNGGKSSLSCSYHASDTDCDAPYRACYQTCGGRVESHRECAAFCD